MNGGTSQKPLCRLVFWRCTLVLVTTALVLFFCRNNPHPRHHHLLIVSNTNTAQSPSIATTTGSSSTSTLRKLSARRRLPADEETIIERNSPDGLEVGVVRTSDHTPKSETAAHPLPPANNNQVEDDEEDTTQLSKNGGGGPWNAMEWVSARTAAADNVNTKNTTINATATATGDRTINGGDRCDWLWNEFEEHTSWMSNSSSQRAERYHHQATDASSYYRASSHIFWVDFVQGNWSQVLLWRLLADVESEDEDEENNNNQTSSLPLTVEDMPSVVLEDEYATYTWVSGDLHLLNFGAWKNRHGDIVFGMNDFDEGAVYDFQIDLMRLAISIYDQVLVGVLVAGRTDPQLSNGVAVARRVVRAFVDSYVKTVLSYVNNEDALTTELTAETSVGALKTFLESLHDDSQYSREKQLQKYTKKFDDNDNTNSWRFKKGTMENPKHKLAEVSSEMESKIRQAFSATEYGGTLLKFGSSLTVGRWDEDFYKVLDVAARIGSGIGSYGVDRYYVLIRGDPSSTAGKGASNRSAGELGPFILDVKYQPPGSFRGVLSPLDQAWYDMHFMHSAARVTEAQRKLTAFTDRFTGWLVLNDDDDDDDEDNSRPSKPFTVRERSPWKEDFNLDSLFTADDEDGDGLVEFMVQVGFTTATSHVRGNIAQAPGDFKTVLHALLGEDPSRLEEWAGTVVDLAASYHEQVLVDFDCFKSRVQDLYPPS